MNRLFQLTMVFVLLQGYKLQAFEAEPTTITTADIVSAITLDRSCLNYCIIAVPKCMSSTISANLSTAFKIKGVNYSITSACSTL